MLPYLQKRGFADVIKDPDMGLIRGAQHHYKRKKKALSFQMKKQEKGP